MPDFRKEILTPSCLPRAWAGGAAAGSREAGPKASILMSASGTPLSRSPSVIERIIPPGPQMWNSQPLKGSRKRISGTVTWPL